MADQFETTRWSFVLAAAAGGEPAGEALEWLCKTYWYPLYAYVRRQQQDAEAARDLTQSFFLELLEASALRQIDPQLGKFRAFLLASIKNFLSHQRERESAIKRRADNPAFQVELDGAESKYSLESTDALSPEQLFETKWAKTVLDRVLHRLKEEHSGAGKNEVFLRLRAHLTGDEPAYEKTADELGLTPGAVRVAVHRLRRRLGVLLREEVAQTVAEPADVDAELRSLLQAASRA